ncbi:GNAT family N-acetyltransferase [Nocardia brasiliensis]|uniref:GNAT family N-acetyltransferase n=1 Tax=Nocardia brasiliensis TaxID=37326 RepID=UPI0024553883|nr:GNAT family N-acetyltransferase [Nocardia brasiliensis]
MDSVAVRLMRTTDVPGAERASGLGFLEVDRHYRRVNEPEPEPRSEADAKQWSDRLRYFLTADPAGCWVATHDDEVVGLAVSQNREQLWYLASYVVLPGQQGTGIGKRLMDAVLAHAGDRAGMISASGHPGATRRYRLAGFSLHPQMRMVGTVDRSTLPAVTGLAEGTAEDFDWMDRLDQQLRGAGHGPDHGYLLGANRLVVSRAEPGYVYLDAHGNTKLLAAGQPDTARKLLWEALATAPGAMLVNSITTANEWAIDVGLAARLDLFQEGYLALRGMEEPRPYLINGAFL